MTGSSIILTARLHTDDPTVSPELDWWRVEFDAGGAFVGIVSATDSADPDFPAYGVDPPMLTNNIPPEGLNLGRHNITWTARDMFADTYPGHETTATQEVIVQVGTPPTIGAITWTQTWAHAQANPLPVGGTVGIGGTITIQADTLGGASLAALNFVGTSTDLCDAGAGVTFGGLPAVLAVSLPAAPVVHELACTATDGQGNSTTGIVFIEVVDTLPPDVSGVTTTALEIGQPEHERSIDPDLQEPWELAELEPAFLYWGVTWPIAVPTGAATDICDGALDEENDAEYYGATLRDDYRRGDNPIIWSFTDDSGNSASVTQNLFIRWLYPGPGGAAHTH